MVTRLDKRLPENQPTGEGNVHNGVLQRRPNVSVAANDSFLAIQPKTRHRLLYTFCYDMVIYCDQNLKLHICHHSFQILKLSTGSPVLLSGNYDKCSNVLLRSVSYYLMTYSVSCNEQGDNNLPFRPDAQR